MNQDIDMGQRTTLSQALIDRGVNPTLAAALIVQHGSIAVARTIAWWDTQHGRVGAGVLVAELRAGANPGARGPAPARSLQDEQITYGRRIRAWLEDHFPELHCHPAAIAAVIRLHHRHGKGSLTVAQHGETIRQAVARFQAQHAEGADEAEVVEMAP